MVILKLVLLEMMNMQIGVKEFIMLIKSFDGVLKEINVEIISLRNFHRSDIKRIVGTKTVEQRRRKHVKLKPKRGPMQK